MVESTKSKAKEFLNKINQNDRVAIITDHDPDGFTSGTLFYDYCESKKAKITQFTWVRGISNKDSFSLDEPTKIITTDLAASQVGPLLHKYQNIPAMFMDHHPKDAELPKQVIEYRTINRGYIPSARSAYELTSGKKWIALAGVIADVGDRYLENKEFIEESLKEINMNLKEFKKQIVFPIANCILYLEEKPAKAFNLIRKMKNLEDILTIEEYSKPIESEVESAISKFEKEKENIKGITFFYFKSKHNIKARVNGISLEPENEKNIYLFATPKTKERISISARSQSKRMDMATLLKAGINNLENVAAGGHFAASGATINTKDLKKFKNNIREYLLKNPIPT